jgi:hypothetical protein
MKWTRTWGILLLLVCLQTSARSEVGVFDIFGRPLNNRGAALLP